MDGEINRFSEEAEFLKALAHPVRLCIVRGLLDKGGCNVSYIQECLSLPQSTVSQHLQRLRRAKIVAAEKRGLEICYKVADDRVKAVVEAVFSEEVQKRGTVE